VDILIAVIFFETSITSNVTTYILISKNVLHLYFAIFHVSKNDCMNITYEEL